jgi:hypothetical protein
MRTRMRTALILTWTVAAVLGSGPMAAQVPPAAVPVLVELFTSEGCSSCPPADQLLSELMRTQPVSGVRIVGLSEHVDYWDHQGWKDPFSDALFTRRQQDHAGSAPSDVYTPQVLADGGGGVVGSDRAAVLTAIREAAGAPKIPITVSWSGADRKAVAIIAPADKRAARASVFLAITEDGLQSSVKRGENEGRELKHDGVTRRLLEVGRADETGAFRRVVPVSLDSAWNRARLRLVAFVQSSSGRVVAVQVLSAG